MLVKICLVIIFIIYWLRVFWRWLNNPHRPFVAALLDSLAEIPNALRIGPWENPLSVRKAFNEAKKRTNLSDVGFPNDKINFLNRYDVSRSSALEKSKAIYSPGGKALIFESLVNRLADRLKLIEFLKNHPDVEKIKLKPPVFVIGFPRTGTTFLHELLSIHESVRSHRTWEQVAIVPNTQSENLDDLERDRSERYKANKTKFDIILKHLIGDRMQHIHRLGYEETEECTFPCGFELPWGLVDLPLMVLASEEVLPMGAGHAYQLYYKILQLLTWQAKDRRNQDFTWMLKCPFHLPYLEDLIQAFPGATIVLTHRDPAECIASASSMYETIMWMGCEEKSIDPKLIGKSTLKYSKQCMVRAQETLDKFAGKINVVNVRYMDTVKDPKKLCQDVLAKAGIPFTSEYEKNLDEYLRKNAEQRKQMKQKAATKVLHEYKPEDFGLTADEIRTEFSDYIKRFNLLEKSK